MKKINVYIIARISKEYHVWTDSICKELTKAFNIFIPKDHNPWYKRHEKLSKHVFDIDLAAINKSDLGLMLPEYGSDCAWEAGWYASAGKPVVVFIESQMEWLQDWMVKGGVTCVVTNLSSTYKILKQDPILKHKKIILIKHKKELTKIIKSIWKGGRVV